MLFKRRVLDGVAAGTITVAFRRWHRPTVRTGGRLRTAIGVLAIDSVSIVTLDDIREADARRAGFESRTEILKSLRADGDGSVYRVDFHFAGPDSRIELRQSNALTDDELERVNQRLRRLDARSQHGPWTGRVLQVIRDRPAVRAADLAVSLGQDTPMFKRDVRKLKELGLTESLVVGYRLAPRGQALLARLKSKAGTKAGSN